MSAELLDRKTTGFQPTQWWLLDSGIADAYSNMAIDEFLATKANLDAPVLRFYQWQPYSISLGYNQRIEDVNPNACKADGIDVVRRPTGGRAVLHAEEVTYAIILPQKISGDKKRDSVLQTYNYISQALVEGLKILGCDVRLEQGTGGNVAYAARTTEAIPCFSASAQFEVMSEGRKMVGSAQRRFERGILQHGSILTGRFHERLPLYLNIAEQVGKERLMNSLTQKTISISQLLNHSVSYREVVEAIISGFVKKYQICFSKKQPDSLDWQGIESIKRSYLQIREVIP